MSKYLPEGDLYHFLKQSSPLILYNFSPPTKLCNVKKTPIFPGNKYLESEGRTVSYRSSLVIIDLWLKGNAKAKRISLKWLLSDS